MPLGLYMKYALTQPKNTFIRLLNYKTVRSPVTSDSNLYVLVTELVLYSSCLFPVSSFSPTPRELRSVLSQTLVLERQLFSWSNINIFSLFVLDYDHETLNLKGKSVSEGNCNCMPKCKKSSIFFAQYLKVWGILSNEIFCMCLLKTSVEWVVAWKWKKDISVFSHWWIVILKIKYFLFKYIVILLMKILKRG